MFERCACHVETPVGLTDIHEARAEEQSEIDSVLERIGTFPQVIQCLEGPLERRHGLGVGRPSVRAQSGAAIVVDGLFPPLAAQRVPAELLDVLLEALGIEVLHGLDDAGMEGAAAFMEDAGGRDLVGERMLERVLEVREPPRLVKELGGPEPVEATTERLLR